MTINFFIAVAVSLGASWLTHYVTSQFLPSPVPVICAVVVFALGVVYSQGLLRG